MKIVTSLLLLALVPFGIANGEHPVHFEMRVLTVDTNEGCAIGDIDGDGQSDVVAGRNWFRNGDWLPRPIRNFGDQQGYAESNSDHLIDVNQDGRLDVIAGGFFDPDVHWYENPGEPALRQGLMWKKHRLASTGQTTNEFTFMVDIDGDKVPEWITNQWNKEETLQIWKLVLPTTDVPGQPATFVRHVVGPANGHGIGVGDLNGDGRLDLMVGTGWYEGPENLADDLLSSKWTFHPDWDRQFSCPSLIRDVDGDGRNDIVWGNPHDFGIYVWLYRGMKKGKWTYEEKQIDDAFSQAHSLHFADLNGDGREELISGKRVRAHNGKDPGANDVPTICYYVLNEQGDFTRHVIHRGQAGIGLQIRSGDLDNDGDVDLVFAGKDGTEIFFNKGAL